MSGKAAQLIATEGYQIARQVASGTTLVQSLMNLFGNEEEKKFEPNRDPYDDNDIANPDAIVADDSDRINPQVQKPIQNQDLPETEIEDQKYKLDVQGLRPLSEEEMLDAYRPQPGEQLQQHVRNYLLFEEAHQYFSQGELEDMQPSIEEDQFDEDQFEAVSVGDDDAQALLSDFDSEIQQSDEIDIRRVDPQQARSIAQTIRRMFPNIDRTTLRRLTKGVMIICIARQIPFKHIGEFINKFINQIWEWLATHQPPKQKTGTTSEDVQEFINRPLPTQCKRKIFYRDGRIVSIIVCSDEQGVRYYQH